MYQDMLEYARMYEDVLGYIRICQEVLGCVRMQTRIFHDMIKDGFT